MKLKIYQEKEQDINSLGKVVRFIMVSGEDGSLDRTVYEGSIKITPDMELVSSEIPRVCMLENAIRVFKKFYLENYLSEGEVTH